MLGRSVRQVGLDGTLTEESGYDFASINVWLQLAATFDPDDYSGIVTFSVSNN
ncbi:hypothetical protein ACFLTL_00300 [Chloroflexota bacterium]